MVSKDLQDYSAETTQCTSLLIPPYVLGIYTLRTCQKLQYKFSEMLKAGSWFLRQHLGMCWLAAKAAQVSGKTR